MCESKLGILRIFFFSIPKNYIRKEVLYQTLDTLIEAFTFFTVN